MQYNTIINEYNRINKKRMAHGHNRRGSNIIIIKIANRSRCQESEQHPA